MANNIRRGSRANSSTAGCSGRSSHFTWAPDLLEGRKRWNNLAGINFLFVLYLLCLLRPVNASGAVQSLLEQHLQVSGGLTSRPPSYKWCNPNLQGQISALKDVLVKTFEYIYIFTTLFSLSLSLPPCTWVWEEKKAGSVESTLLPVLLTCFYFPLATCTRKERANQQQITPQVTASRVEREVSFLPAETREPCRAEHLCFLMAGQQADKWSTATSQPS